MCLTATFVPCSLTSTSILKSVVLQATLRTVVCSSLVYLMSVRNWMMEQALLNDQTYFEEVRCCLELTTHKRLEMSQAQECSQ